MSELVGSLEEYLNDTDYQQKLTVFEGHNLFFHWSDSQHTVNIVKNNYFDHKRIVRKCY